jgi:hypothetical protein
MTLVPELAKEEFFRKEPGAALNAPPFEAAELLDFTGPPGSLTGLYYGLMFQLGKWGFGVVKIDEWVNVSPVNKPYFDLTIGQKATMEGQIKAGLAQIASAIHDYELVWHDLRKYKEFLDYFTKIEQGKRLIKQKKEEGEKLLNEGEKSLKAIFIDQVDVHTGETVALKLIAPRWPTIIADFLKLEDSDTDPKKTADKLKVSEAEGVVLATKNKLYLEWRDRLFKETVKERYERILRLVEMRKTSIKQYTEMLRPVIARYKMITDALESAGGRAAARQSFFKPDAQAYSTDFMHVWAWRPFAPAEKYKITRENLNKIPARSAGFSGEEIKTLIKLGKLDKDARVDALPDEPSIDFIVRRYWQEKKSIDKRYGVTLTIEDLFDARKRLADQYVARAAEVSYTAERVEIQPGASWVFSPYFIFLDIPLYRTMLRLPNGQEFEDFWIENFKTILRSQNIIILNQLEVIAREKQLENYINQLLGESGVSGESLKSIEELKKMNFPEIYMTEEELTKKMEGEMKKAKGTGKDLGDFNRKFKTSIGSTLKSIGINVSWLRTVGHYEFAMEDRLAEVFQPDVGGMFFTVKGYLQQNAGVPGARW